MAIINPEALQERANNLAANGLNGFRLILVDLPGPDEAIMTIHFQNDEGLDDILSDPGAPKIIFPITGGHRAIAGPGAGQVQVTAIAALLDAMSVRLPNILQLTVRPIGDYSTYTLHLNFTHIDPLFSEIDFKFRPGCFNLCAPDWERPPAPKPDPVIDYLAKDYESFRHTMIAAMMQRVPDWQPTSEADLDQTLLELFSAAADELSDYQDRVMNEAYLSTARKRVSLARHSRLMDYHIHQGNQASTWLALELADEEISVLHEHFLSWAGLNLNGSSAVVFMSRDARQQLFSMDLSFQGDLNAGSFSLALRNRFEANGVILSATVSILVKDAGERWLIIDSVAHQTYVVKEVGSQLNVYKPALHFLLNQMGLYTWSDAIPALAAGSTTADLLLSVSGQTAVDTVRDLIRDCTIQYLLIQEHLNPSTGREAGRDPVKRQLLKLLPGDQGAESLQDPLTGAWFLRVRWEEKDKLKNNYCFTVNCPGGAVDDVSLFHGNLVQVYHGRRVETVFTEPGAPLAAPDRLHYQRTERWGTLCRLPEGPLAYRETAPGGEEPVKSTLEVEVLVPGSGSTEWHEFISLIHSDENDDHFLVETDEEGRSLIRFGNGGNGRDLREQAEVHCAYQIGNGLDGNIGADKLSQFDRAVFPEIDKCWNPFDVTNGRAPELAVEIIRRAPEAYRYRQLRAVTLKDYVNRAQELPEVSRAAARYAWTGSWRTVQIAIDPAGATELNDDLRLKIASHLDVVRLLGEDLELRPPRFVPLEIHLALCLHPDYWPEDVKSLLEQEFSDGFTPDGRMGFFHPDLWTFGQELRPSQILGRAQAVEGVEHVIALTMKRWNEATPGAQEVITVGANEIILVKNNPDHLEEGFMFFDVRGGRQ